MYSYILRKFFAGIITVLIVIVFFYFLFVAVKGNPISIENFQTSPNPEKEYQNTLEFYGLNDPIYERFWNWVVGIFQGNWGNVYNPSLLERGETIPSMFFKNLRFSIWIFIPSNILGMILGISLGYFAGYNRGKVIDIIINIILTIFIAIPTFIFAAFFLLFAASVNLPIHFQNPNTPGNSYLLFFTSILSPIIVMLLVSLAGWAYFLRNEVGNILISDYVLAARTKGFSNATIFKKYVLRNSLYPLIGNIVTSYMVLFSSSIVIERFFNVPGVSKMLLESNKNGEINILMFQLVFFSSIGVFSQVLVDIVQFSINPIVKANFSQKSSFVTKIVSYFARRKQKLLKLKGSAND